MVKILEAFLTPPAATTSEIPMKIERSGAVSVDVQAFLVSPKGQAELSRLDEAQRTVTNADLAKAG
jgi:hypothetical protein